MFALYPVIVPDDNRKPNENVFNYFPEGQTVTNQSTILIQLITYLLITI